MKAKEAIRKLKLLQVQHRQKGNLATCEALELGIEAIQGSEKLPKIINEIHKEVYQEGIREGMKQRALH